MHETKYPYIYIYIYVVPYRTRAFPRDTLPAEQNSCERITQLLNQYVWEATGASASSTLLHPHFCNLECVFSLECWVWVQQKPSHIQHGRLQLWYGRLLFWAWNHHATPWRACLLSQVRWQIIRWKIDHWFSLWVIHFHFSTIFMFLCIFRCTEGVLFFNWVWKPSYSYQPFAEEKPQHFFFFFFLIVLFTPTFFLIENGKDFENCF